MSLTETQDDTLIAVLLRLPVACMLTRVADSRVLAVNPAFTDLFGWGEKQIVGLHSSELPIWSTPEQRDDFLQRFSRTDRIEQCETSLRCRLGEPKPCLVYIERIDFNGEPCRLSMAHDMSQRNSAELALKQSEAKFSALFIDVVF